VGDSPIIDVHGEEVIVGATKGLVYILEDRVALDVPNFGRIEFPEAVAQSVGLALLRGSKMLREGRAKQGVKIL
jgi:hypothetical protein